MWIVSAQADIDVRYSHIPGSKNKIADVLSRWQNTEPQLAFLHSKVHNPVWIGVPDNILHIDDEI